MDRFTSRDEAGDLLLSGKAIYGNDQDVYNAIGRLEEYEDTGLTPEEINKLAEARKEGRLAELPCKIWDTVYDISSGEIQEMCVQSIEFDDSASYVYLSEGVTGVLDSYDSYNFSDFGKIKFFTREEAGAALKEKITGTVLEMGDKK